MLSLVGVVALLALLAWFFTGRGRGDRPPAAAEDIDREALEAAEREVRHLGIDAKPSADLDEDDLGPGTSRSNLPL